MRALPLRYLTAEIRMSAATSTRIVAALIFFEGLAALADVLTGLSQVRIVFRLSILGLLAGPGLLLGSKLAYWYALISITLSAIFSAAAVTVSAGVWWLKLTVTGAPWGAMDAGLMLATVMLTLLCLWAVRVLRNPEVRTKFGV